MANQNKRRPTREDVKALDLVEEWLHMESVARPNRRRNLHRNSAYSRSRPLYKTEIPAKWEALQEHIDYFLHERTDDEDRNLRIGRSVLEAASLAQHGFIMGRVALGANIFTAMDESWHVVQGFKQHFRMGNAGVPQVENFELPVEDAIKKYTGRQYGDTLHTYVGMVAYSTTAALALREPFTHKFVLPSAGLPEDRLERWDYDPQ